MQLLLNVRAELRTDITWNHLYMDLPGVFPRGSPLHFAIHCHQPEIVKMLLSPKVGSDHLNYPGSLELTPMEYASKLHCPEIVDLLIVAGALNDLTKNEEVLHWISILPRYEEWAVNGICNFSEEPVITCATQLLACRSSFLEAPDEMGYTPIMIAAYKHKESVVKFLIDQHCNVDVSNLPEYDGRTALSLYADNHLSYESDDIVDMLYTAGASLESASSSGKRVLHFAARNDVLGAAEKVLKLGAQIEGTTHYGETPLHIAAHYNSVTVGRLLLDKGANTIAEHGVGTINETDWKGLTPVAFAAARSHKEFMKLLLEYDVNPVARPSNDDSIIHFAVTETNIKVLNTVLALEGLANTDILNRVNKNGLTALHLCAGNLGRQDHIVALVKAGAAINRVSNSGFSVLDIAQQTLDFIIGELQDQDQGNNTPV